MLEICFKYLELAVNLTFAFLALITSLVAIYFTWRGLKIQREHNFKSVKPIGEIRLGDFKNKIYIRFINNGNGPLIIKKVYVNNNLLKKNEGFIDKLTKETRSKITWTSYTSDYKNRSISPNQDLTLLRWSIKQTKNREENKNLRSDQIAIRNELSKIHLKIIYTDIYGSKKFKKQKTFDWFNQDFDKIPED